MSERPNNNKFKNCVCSNSVENALGSLIRIVLSLWIALGVCISLVFSILRAFAHVAPFAWENPPLILPFMPGTSLFFLQTLTLTTVQCPGPHPLLHCGPVTDQVAPALSTWLATPEGLLCPQGGCCPHCRGGKAIQGQPQYQGPMAGMDDAGPQLGGTQAGWPPAPGECPAVEGGHVTARTACASGKFLGVCCTDFLCCTQTFFGYSSSKHFKMRCLALYMGSLVPPLFLIFAFNFF